MKPAWSWHKIHSGRSLVKRGPQCSSRSSNRKPVLVVRDHRLAFQGAGSTANAQIGLHQGWYQVWLTVGRMSDKKSACRHLQTTVSVMPADSCRVWAEQMQGEPASRTMRPSCRSHTSQAAVRGPTFASLMPSGTLRALMSASGTLAYSACRGEPHQCQQYFQPLVDCSPKVSTNLATLIAPSHCRVSAAAEQHLSVRAHPVLQHLLKSAQSVQQLQAVSRLHTRGSLRSDAHRGSPAPHCMQTSIAVSGGQLGRVPHMQRTLVWSCFPSCVKL